MLIRLITKEYITSLSRILEHTGKASLFFQSLRWPHKVPQRVTFCRCHMFHVFRHSSTKTCIRFEIYLGWVLSWFVFTMVKCLTFTRSRLFNPRVQLPLSAKMCPKVHLLQRLSSNRRAPQHITIHAPVLAPAALHQTPWNVTGLSFQPNSRNNEHF